MEWERIREEGLESGQGQVAAELLRIYEATGQGPERASVLLQLGRLCLAAGLPEGAEEFLSESCELEAGLATAWFERGRACQLLCRDEEAADYLRRGLDLEPALPEGNFRLGQAMQALGRHSEALQLYQKVGYGEAHAGKARHNEALIALQRGDFARGWEAYEHRWDENPRMARRSFAGRLWLGWERLEGRTILLHAEQGLGDTLQFVRHARQVAGLGARVLLEVQAPLAGLLAANGLAEQVIARGEPLPPHDFHCPLCSLPLALGRRGVSALAAQPPYLRAAHGDSPALERVRVVSGRPRIGVSWRGNPLHGRDRQRSIPGGQFRDLFAAQGGHFFGLQLSPPMEPAFAEGLTNFTDLSDCIGSFADTAAVVAELDLVICVDTALAHLAGAMGRPAWLLLPAVADWRWGLEGEGSCWYPSLRLLRQARGGGWGELLGRVIFLLDLGRGFGNCAFHGRPEDPRNLPESAAEARLHH